MPHGQLHTAIPCPICSIVIDSHTSYRESGVLVDEHLKAKHPEHIIDPDRLDFGDTSRPRGKGVYE